MHMKMQNPVCFKCPSSKLQADVSIEMAWTFRSTVESLLTKGLPFDREQNSAWSQGSWQDSIRFQWTRYHPWAPYFLLFKQPNTLQSRHFRLSLRFFPGEQLCFDDAPRIGIDLPSWLVRFFFRKIDRFFAVDQKGFSQVLGESFPEVLALQSNDEKLVKVGHAAEGFFFSSDVVGWLVGAFTGRKGDLMWELFFCSSGGTYCWFKR